METEPSTGESRLQDGTATYQFEPDTPLSETVIAAIASESGMDVLEIADEFGPLYDAVDPTALDSLFQSTGQTERSVGSVTFEYADYRVTVDQTGQVLLEDRE
ncbi:HalOD1 output domain-containing protein [Natrinema amylolyticum]|uniref:HalOD1 output domain-containing protein n=1 Tax=Natrinema amylolyticum TaxID=2878679 RepID=UPI001CFBFE54|nr:HalOD1 output domain-containing protein [Natrinema amylolyticum]